MSEGDRLIDAINAAGGYLPDADSRMLNHAMKLADEFVIYVPIEGEESSDIVTASTSMPGTSAQQSDGKININTGRRSRADDHTWHWPVKSDCHYPIPDGSRAFQNPGIADGSIRDWPENVREARNSY